MISSQQELVEYVQEQINKYDGVAHALKASLPERMFRKTMNVKYMHPNPVDEFTHKDVGPSFRILNEYREQLRQAKREGGRIFDEKIIVEKMAPDGYLILNGHHRWAAATLERQKKVRVSVVNVTHGDDVHRMLNKSTRSKRVAMDLDTVIFASEDCKFIERAGNKFLSHFYSEKIMLGRAGLIERLHAMDYDVWVYTRGYHSTEYIEKLFGCYNVTIDGIINGVGKNNDPEKAAEMRERIEQKYTLSLHIENERVSFIDKSTREFISREVIVDTKDWSKKMLAIISEIEVEYGSSK